MQTEIYTKQRAPHRLKFAAAAIALTTVLLIAGASLPLQGSAQALAPQVGSTCGWEIAGYPNANPDYQILYGVAAVSPTDVWGVGSSQANGQPVQSLIVHGDGSSWSIVPSPRPGTASEFEAVAAVSPNDVWAVGWYWASGGGQHTLIAHWDGQVWTQANSPNFGPVNSLDDIVVVSANDIWAVGGYGIAPGEGGPLTMHWDGSEWTIVPTPNGPEGSALLWSVTAISSDDVWAVGDENVPLGQVHTDHTFTIHWDGTQWSYVPSPNVGDRNNIFYAVEAVASDDVWAAGTRYNRADVTWYPLFQHWNGVEWKVIDSPHAGPSANFVYGLAAIASDDIWAIGLDFSRNPRGVLAHHWDGTRWSLTNLPQPQGHNDAWDITHIGSEIWFVGKNYHYEGLRRDVPMVGHYTGPCGTATPGPTRTPTPAATSTSISTPSGSATSRPPSATAFPPTSISTSTSAPTVTAVPSAPLPSPSSTASPGAGTPLPPTATSTYSAPTRTPAICSITFTDVPMDHTFYESIKCLACRGVLGGYQDQTFRPGNEITRGQVAKVVSNAAGFDDDISGRWTYADMPPVHTFWMWVERLSMRGHISGYACGGPGEPCDGQSRPYFRPYTNTTRGQLSRIVSNAAGFVEPVTGTFYTDVTEDNPFYSEIMGLTNRGVMSGYPCGTVPHEPCDGQQRPYFRWGNMVTRGQASKIVANVFIPDCRTP